MAGSTLRSVMLVWNNVGDIMKAELKIEDKFITQ